MRGRTAGFGSYARPVFQLPPGSRPEGAGYAFACGTGAAAGSGVPVAARNGPVEAAGPRGIPSATLHAAGAAGSAPQFDMPSRRPAVLVPSIHRGLQLVREVKYLATTTPLFASYMEQCVQGPRCSVA